MRRRVSFYTDDHISNALVRTLRRRGADVITAREAGNEGAPDESHLETAHKLRRVIITQDEDFLALAANGFTHSGIAYAHQTTPWQRMSRSLSLLFEVLKAEDMVGKVEFL